MEINEYNNIYQNEKTYWWYVGLHELVENYIKQKQKELGKKILLLDAGCGTGGMLKRIENLCDYKGFDISEEALKFCELNTLKNIFYTDINSWNPEEDKYDVIISLDVLYHKLVIDDVEILKKFYISLKNDGILILNLPAFNFLSRAHDKYVHGNKRYTKSRLKNKLKKAGFENNKISYRMSFLFFVLLFKSKTKNTSDLKKIPNFINKFMIYLLRIENFFIKLGFSNSIGTSVFSVSKKN